MEMGSGKRRSVRNWEGTMMEFEALWGTRRCGCCWEIDFQIDCLPSRSLVDFVESLHLYENESFMNFFSFIYRSNDFTVSS
jgi:hypothetical protein